MNGVAFGMLLNSPFLGGCFNFGYPMYGRCNFAGFANPFPCVFGNLGYMNMTIQPMPTTFANAAFPTVDFTAAGQTIWDSVTNPDSAYNRQMKEMYERMEKMAENNRDSSDDKQYIPQTQYPFSSFYMPSSVAVNPWVSGYWGQYTVSSANSDKNSDLEKCEISTKKGKKDKKVNANKTSDENEEKNSNISSDAKTLKAKWSKKQPQLTDQFYSRVIEISNNVNCSPDDLMALMNYESAQSFSPSKKCPISSATGLIQFTGETAKTLGTTISDLKEMSAVQQLDYVEKYLLYWKKENGFGNERLSVGDLYALVAYPGKARQEVLITNGTKAYADNAKNWDLNNDNKITKSELAQCLKPYMA